MLSTGMSSTTPIPAALKDNVGLPVQRVVHNDAQLRRVLGAIVVVAANAGGAWTPIGDVTTTMLWIHGQV
jgi:Na+/H+ antiporter NhaD/arsenite permease-like protein